MSQQEKLPEQLAYRLAHVQVKRFSEEAQSPVGVEGHGLDFAVGLGVELEEAKRLVQVGVGLRLSKPQRGELEAERIAEIDVVCAFEIRDLSPVIGESGHVQIPRPFLANLVGISISTARGVLVGRTQQSWLNEHPLPILVPQELLEGYLNQEDLSWVVES